MIKEKIKKQKTIIGCLVLFLVTFLAYGKILGMYFYLEDYLILFSIQHPDSPDAGYGSGIMGRPYGWAVTPFIPFYYIFGLEPWGYYLVEILLYFIAGLAVFLFVKTLTGDKKAAFGSSLIFASGYVGSGSLYRLAVGWQNILAVIFISLSATFYYRYIKLPTIRNYLIAFALYLFASEFSFYRAHGIIFIILGLEILFNFKLFKSVLRMFPFVLSYWYFYIYSLPFMDQGSKSADFIRTVFQEGNLNYLLTPFKTLGNLFVPDKLNFPFLLFISILIGLLIWKRSKILIYCLLFAMANYIVHFYNSPLSVQDTTHRYLTVSFVGASAFLGILLSGIFKDIHKYLFFCLLIVALNLSLALKEQSELVKNRSNLTREFWQAFQSQIPKLPKGSAIYIDSKQDGVSKPVRDAAVGAGSMSPTTSFAVYYGLDWEDVYLAENFPELLKFIKSGTVNSKNIFTFYYSRDEGLVNTSDETKANLAQQGQKQDVKNLSNIDMKFTSPVLLHFLNDISIEKVAYSEAKNDVNLSKYLQFFVSRSNYLDKATVTSTTQVKYAETRFIKDENNETSWRADDIHWASSRKEEITVDLGEVKLVGSIRMILANVARAPTKYEYECSDDMLQWKSLASIEKKTDKLLEIVDKFSSSDCKFIKTTIFATTSDGPPQISEIEVIESKFSDLDLVIAEKVANDPFLFITSPDDLKELSDHIIKNGINGKICAYTNKSIKPVCKKNIFKLGKNNGSFLIDQGGTVLHKVEFLLPSGIHISTNNVSLEHLTYKELDKMGYIFEY